MHTLAQSQIELNKKLLLLPTILVLVSCQPSELDRCIASNLDNLKDIEELNLTNRRSHPKMKFSNIEKIALFSLIYNKIEDGTIQANEDPIFTQMSPNYKNIRDISEGIPYDEWAVYDLMTFALFQSYPGTPSKPTVAFNREFIKKFQADFIKLQRDEVEPICNSQGIY